MMRHMSELERLLGAKNHFELFDLPVRFTLDRHFLGTKYLELSRATHPDLAGSGADEQLAAMQLSARVNEAFATLSDDLRRAEYLLQMQGGSAAESRLPPEALERVFELREAMVSHDDEAARAKLEAQKWLAGLMVEIAGKLDSGEAGHAVRELISTARYVQKITSI